MPEEEARRTGRRGTGVEEVRDRRWAAGDWKQAAGDQRHLSGDREQNRQKYRCVLIDVDNTILDFDEFVRAAMRDGFRKYHLPEYREEMFGIFVDINDRLWRGIEMGVKTLEDVRRDRWNLIFDRLGIAFDGHVFEEFFRDYLHECAIPVPGVTELIPYLSGRYLLCAASNGPYEQQKYRLGISGMLPYFHHIFISEKVGANKPSARFFDVCLQEIGEDLQPGEVMMIGDSLTADMDGALEYGMATCFFDRNKTGPQGRKVDYVVTHMGDIAGIL